jgi:hypothetical protein
MLRSSAGAHRLLFSDTSASGAGRAVGRPSRGGRLERGPDTLRLGLARGLLAGSSLLPALQDEGEASRVSARPGLGPGARLRSTQHDIPPAGDRLWEPAQLRQPRGALCPGHTVGDANRRRRLHPDYGRQGKRASLLLAALVLSPRHALSILLCRPTDALCGLGAHEPPDLRAGGVRQEAGGVERLPSTRSSVPSLPP